MVNHSKFHLPDDLSVNPSSSLPSSSLPSSSLPPSSLPSSSLPSSSFPPSSSLPNPQHYQSPENSSTFSHQCNHSNFSNSPPPKVPRAKFNLPALSYDQLVSEQNQQVIGPDFELHQNVPVTVCRGNNESVEQQFMISTFEEANLSRQILQNLAKIRFHRPTAVQRRVIPLILQTDEDLLCLASTGTGKTGAFLIPLLNLLQKLSAGFLKSASSSRRSPKAIIIAHTKELVLQIDKTAQILADGTGVGVVLMMGEMRYNCINERIDREGCDMLVATPGRLREFVRKGWVSLDCLRFLVVDEMDKFFSDIEFLQMFRELNDKRNECKNTAGTCRTLFFSATSCEMRALVPFLSPNFFRIIAGLVNQSVSHVRQHIISTNILNRRHLLERILRENETSDSCKKTVIFVNECRRCDRLAIMLCCSNYKAISINGNHTLEQRTRAMAQFNAGQYDILVGTDVLARGMNIPNLSRVILFEMPPLHRYEQFVHRVGRVGRAGNTGEAFVFFNPEDLNDVHMAEFLREQLVLAEQQVPEWLHEMVENQQKWQTVSDERLQNEYSNGKRLRTRGNGTEPTTELDEDQNDLCDDTFANVDW